MAARQIDPREWAAAEEALEAQGYAVVGNLLTDDACAAVVAMYDRDDLFRNRVVMARHNFGQGEYRYFDYPLPGPVAELRSTIYPPLAAIANRWHEAMRLETRFPSAHGDFLDTCHRAGQTRPTPLILKYGPGDYNRLHQDTYGDLVFPLQMTVLLSSPSDDFTGGEFILTEQRPRMQSRAEVVRLDRGDAVIFPVIHRPVAGTRGFYRVTQRHGVSRIHSGNRYTLGVILHDAA